MMSSLSCFKDYGIRSEVSDAIVKRIAYLTDRAYTWSLTKTMAKGLGNTGASVNEIDILGTDKVNIATCFPIPMWIAELKSLPDTLLWTAE